MCNPLMAGLQIGGTIIGAGAAYQEGQATAGMLQYRAAQERTAAGQEMAAGSQRIADADLAGKALESRMMATAAASGVDVTSPTVVNLVSQAHGLTEYNKGMELYNARSRSNSLIDQANADDYSAEQAKQAGKLKAWATILTGGSALLKS